MNKNAEKILMAMFEYCGEQRELGLQMLPRVLHLVNAILDSADGPTEKKRLQSKLSALGASRLLVSLVGAILRIQVRLPLLHNRSFCEVADRVPNQNIYNKQYERTNEIKREGNWVSTTSPIAFCVSAKTFSKEAMPRCSRCVAFVAD